MANLYPASAIPLSHLSSSGDTPDHQGPMDNYATPPSVQGLFGDLDEDLDGDPDEEMQTDCSHEDEDNDEAQEPESDDPRPPQTESSCDTTSMRDNYDSPGRLEAEDTASLRQRLKELRIEQANWEKYTMSLQKNVNLEMARVGRKVYGDIPPLLARLKEKVTECSGLVEDCPGQLFPLPDKATTQASQSGNGKYVPKTALVRFLHSVGQCLENLEKWMEKPEQVAAGSMAPFEPPNSTDFSAFFPQSQCGVQQDGPNFALSSTGLTTQMSCLHTFEGVGGNVQGDVTGNLGSFYYTMNQGNFDNGSTLGEQHIVRPEFFEWDK